MAAPGLILSAIRSGAGKTVVTTAILAALTRRGLRAASAKSGPDYIDPAFHAAASLRPSVNLDSWAMPPDLLDGLAEAAGRDADILLIEGALGLFDGASGPHGRRGATADLAARFALPVVAILDVTGQAQTAAALLRGLAMHDPAVRIAGVILNRVAGERHLRLICEAMAPLGLPLLGALPRAAALALPERHLGLVQAEEQASLDVFLEAAAALAEAHIDLDALVALAAPLRLASPRQPAIALPPPGGRIALARDSAFSFVYPHLVAAWRAAGADIVPFSPLADEGPDETCDACWLPGGYPELHAGRLAAARHFQGALARFAARHPVHGECGGHMVLGRAIIDRDGIAHETAGLLSHVTSFARRGLTLGYRTAQILADGPLGRAGTRLAGHEFHYSTVFDQGNDEPFARIHDAAGADLGAAGARRGLVSGSYFHVVARHDASI